MKNKIIISHKQIQLFVWILAFSLSSCNKNKNKDNTSNVAIEWEDKEILFPENIPCYVSDKETLPELCDEIFRKEFKITAYPLKTSIFIKPLFIIVLQKSKMQYNLLILWII